MRIQIETIQEGFTKTHCWCQSNIGVLDGLAVLITQQLKLSGSDVFGLIHSRYSKDEAKTFSQLTEQPGMHIGERIVTDVELTAHKKSGVLLAIGIGFLYKGDDPLKPELEEALVSAYSVYDPINNRFLRAKRPVYTDGTPIENIFSGHAQRVNLDNGDILQPLIRKIKEPECKYYAAIMRFGFDGETLVHKETGAELYLNHEARGIMEPSLTEYKGKYYITLRTESKGYMAVSDDGLHYGEIKPWLWDTGYEVPTYNTQQHWLKGKNGLYLVYTRRNGKNDHVFRNRAPLYMAKLDLENLCLLRHTEQILTPERGARMGNFGAVHINEDESWVLSTEWMQPVGCEKYGSNNAIYLTRIFW